MREGRICWIPGARGLVPGALSIALAFGMMLPAGQPAFAACTPQSASNITATCTGITNNQGGGPPGSSGDINGNGYGSDGETGITIHVVGSGAQVNGNNIGIDVRDGTVTTDAGASIRGGDWGILTSTGAVVVINSGSITGVQEYGIISVTSATVTNNAGGSITGGNVGIEATTNAMVTNNAGASISGEVGIDSQGGLTLINSGSITGTSDAVQSQANMLVTNNAGAVISGGSLGILAGASATVTNSGTIVGSFGDGIFASFAATVTNNAGASISGSIIGISAQNSTAMVTNNAGASITGGEDGIRAQGGMAAVVNSGNISGTTGFGIFAGGKAMVTNNAGASIAGGQYGISAGAGGSSVFNAGTLGGGTAAIRFAGTGNSLTLAPGSVIAGNVLGTGSDTFQLGGSGTATFDVSQLGAAAQYRGFGTFNKIDSSVWTLTGTSTFAGAVNVNGGTLSVNGDISSAGNLTVNAGGALGGNGIVGNTAINGGTLSPGNSIGLFTVKGNLVFTAASSYPVEVSSSNADRTDVTGTAALGGATVSAALAPGTTAISRRYTILNATRGVVGTFNPVVTPPLLPDLRVGLSYDANDVYLNFALNFGSGLNANQRNVAGALTSFFDAGGSLPLAFASLTPAGLTQLSGESATATQQTTFDAMNQFMDVLIDPFVAGRGDAFGTAGGPTAYAEGSLAYAARGQTGREREAYAAVYGKAPPATPFQQRWSVWAAGYGGSQSTDGNSALGSNNTTSRIAGTAVGADYLFSPNTIAGFALAGGGTNFSVDNLGSGRSDLFQAGAYVRHTEGAAYITGALAYGWQDITTDRTVTAAGLDHLRAEFNANAYSGRVEGGYRFVAPWVGGVGITPYAAGQFTTFDLPTYAESVVAGTPAFALAYAAKSVTDTRSELGIRTDKSFAVQNGVLTLRGRFAWAHDFDPDRAIAATFQALPGASFVVNGAALASDSVLTTASIEMKWINGWSAAATFEGEFSQVTASYAGKGVVRYAW